MTLHLSAIVGDTVFQVSDRLASLNERPWDSTWNKTIVLRTVDALVVIGFVGPAFVGQRPVDEWVAEILWDAEIPSGTMFAGRPGGPLRRGLSASLASVERAMCEAVKAGTIRRADGMSASLVGWRIDRRLVRVCGFVLDWGPDGLPHFRRRTRSLNRRVLVGANPRVWVPGARVVALRQDIVDAESDTEREDRLIQVLRAAADAGHPVGRDVMCVRITNSRPVPRIRFAPAEQARGTFTDYGIGATYEVPAIYTPTIITPECAQLPCLGTGPPSEKLNGFEIEWDLPSLPPPWAPDGRTLLWRIEGQTRPARP